MIFWHGQERGKNFNDNDFIALSLNDGIVELRCRLNGQEDTILHEGTRVDDNKRHIVIVKHSKNQISLELDGLSQYGETRPTEREHLYLPGHVFIGMK
jgi:hypothetical protein